MFKNNSSTLCIADNESLKTKHPQRCGHTPAPGYSKLRHKTDILALNLLRMIRTHVKLFPNRAPVKIPTFKHHIPHPQHTKSRIYLHYPKGIATPSSAFQFN